MPRPGTTIVQLSDTHITEGGRLAYGKVDTHAALARAVAHVERLPETLGPIAAVVVSGDLTDLGTEAEYAAFRQIVAPLRVPLLVLPGNHDARGPMRAAFADRGLPAGEGPIDYAGEAGDVRIVALDSTVPGAAHGALAADQIAWLDATLAAAPDRPTLLFVHHPPFDTGIGHMDRQRLRDEGPFLETLARHPQVLLVGCGHVHRTISTSLAGVPCRIAPSPAHAVSLVYGEGRPTFDLEPGGVTIHRWQPAEGAPFGRLQSQLSFVGPFEGPHPFFPD